MPSTVIYLPARVDNSYIPATSARDAAIATQVRSLIAALTNTYGRIQAVNQAVRQEDSIRAWERECWVSLYSRTMASMFYGEAPPFRADADPSLVMQGFWEGPTELTRTKRLGFEISMLIRSTIHLAHFAAAQGPSGRSSMGRGVCMDNIAVRLLPFERVRDSFWDRTAWRLCKVVEDQEAELNAVLGRIALATGLPEDMLGSLDSMPVPYHPVTRG